LAAILLQRLWRDKDKLERELVRLQQENEALREKCKMLEDDRKEVRAVLPTSWSSLSIVVLVVGQGRVGQPKWRGALELYFILH
jgi:hypothetical protein